MVYQGSNPSKTGGHESAARTENPDLHITHVMTPAPLPRLSLMATEQGALQIADGGGESPSVVYR